MWARSRILNRLIERMGLEEELTLALKNPGYTDALLALLKNILVDRSALYAVGEWAALYDEGLVAQGKIGDDKLGRALDRLFAADRATLQTRVVLAVMKGFDLRMDQIHNDTTSVMVRGTYDGQNAKAIQLKRGHSKERRPDLKQLVYSLCVTSDGAVPVHFKAYDGNQTDDGIHLETWNRLRTLLQHPRFIYVADCKLCTPATCAGRRSCASAQIAMRRRSMSSNALWVPIICGRGLPSTGTDPAKRRSAMRAIVTSGSSAR